MPPPQIHPTAIIEDGAVIDDDAIIAAYARIGPQVQIGAYTHVQHGAVVEGRTRLGRHNQLFPYACVGLPPQDKKYDGQDTELIVGDHNIFREHCTIHKGTEDGGGITSIGDHNLFMETSHIGHDCIIGDHCVFAHAVGLAGHCKIEDYAILGGFAGLHQFVHIGTFAFVGADSGIGLDVLPFAITQGSPAKLRGVNRVGCERAGFPPEEIRAIQRAHRVYFATPSSEGPLERLKEAFPDPPRGVQLVIDFIAGGGSQRGFMRPRERGAQADAD